MHPILFKIGPLTIHTYGLMIALAFLLGIWLMSHQAKKEGLNPQVISDLGFYLLAGAIIGSRLLFVIINYERYLSAPLKVFYIWEGGLVFYGGLIGAMGLGFWYLKEQQLPFWTTVDLAAPSIALGQAIGRLGCFSAGCCYGRPTLSFWGVTFTDLDCLAPLGVKLHPVQFYSALTNLTIFFILFKLQRAKKFSGQLLGSYLVLYAVGRFALEFWRGDQRGFVNLLGANLSTSQFISFFVLAGGIGLLLWRRRIFSTENPQNKKGKQIKNSRVP